MTLRSSTLLGLGFTALALSGAFSCGSDDPKSPPIQSTNTTSSGPGGTGGDGSGGAGGAGSGGAPTCLDETQNGVETDVDCGGVLCVPCDVGLTCEVASDCVEKVCTGNVCQPAACNDSIPNGDETDADCGGSCNNKCPAGQKCLDDADCTTGKCGTNHVCACPAGMVIAPITGGGSHCIDAYEVTYAQYTVFYNANPSLMNLPAACVGNLFTPLDNWPPLPSKVGFPVTYIDWCDAYTYCRYVGKHLCGKIGGGTNDPAAHADPTSSEWFNACTAQGVNDFPYGDVYVQDNCNGNVPTGGSPVKQESDSTCEGGVPGLYHMSGDVTEWEDSCDAGGQCRVRGGAYSTPVAGLRCDASDFRARSDNTHNDVGFRCCL